MKKFLTAILSFVMLIALTTATALCIVRTVLSGDTMMQIINVVSEESYNTEDINALTEEILGDEYNKEILEYIDQSKMNNIVGDLFEEYLLYTSGVSEDKPETKKLKEYLEKVISEYEEKEDINVDTEYLDSFFEELDNEIENTNIETDENVKQIFTIIYSDTLYYGSFGVVAFCILCIFLLNKSIKKTLKSTGTVAVINGISIYGLGYALNLILSTNTEEQITKVAEIIYTVFTKYGITSLVIGIILIVVSVIIKNNTSVDDSNKAIRNLDSTSLNQNYPNN